MAGSWEEAHLVNTVMPGWSCSGICESAGRQNTPSEMAESSKMWR
jgi:hypothetical protein